MKVTAGDTFIATVTGAPTGRVGDLGATITLNGNPVVPHTTSGITETPANSGIYQTTLTAPVFSGLYLIVWDLDGNYATEQLQVTLSVPPGAAYAIPSELQAETSDNPPTDPEAEQLLETASNLVDSMLGARPINSQGRKVTQSQVKTWQWNRINRATILIAVTLHRNPTVLTEQTWSEVTGPDFSTKGPGRVGFHVFGDEVLDLVRGSQLGVSSGRAT